jgi:NAD(P)-dependent dehydrogenase (short-subunit alcohol dehydrogenase family)
MDGMLAGKVAIITGTASGVGRSAALLFAREGARLITSDIDVAGGEETLEMVRSEGGDGIFVETDVSDRAAVDSLVRAGVEAFGRLDCAFNCAGIDGNLEPLLETTEQDWERVISTNLKGHWHLMKAEIPEMLKRGKGSIVNIASVCGKVGLANNTIYCAARFGDVGMTKVAALEFAERGIRVNAIAPGGINTPPVPEVHPWQRRHPELRQADASHEADRGARGDRRSRLLAMLGQVVVRDRARVDGGRRLHCGVIDLEMGRRRVGSGEVDTMRRIGILLLPCSLALACASAPYPYGSDLETELTLPLRPGEGQIERGRPHRLVDGLGHYLFSLPSKLLLLDWKVDNHDISTETEAGLREYLDANGLCNVKVRLNQYAPAGEWSRLARNREMPLAWRWTLGLYAVTMYTILPERVFAGLFGGDHYNPYTNTISLYSDRRAIGIHEAGHAKDFARKRDRHWKGGYAALRLLPLVPLWQEGAATAEAIGWERAHGSGKDERSAYRRLYPAYATYVGGEIGRWYGGFWVPYAAVVPGHIAGWARSFAVEDRERVAVDPSMMLELRTRSCVAIGEAPPDPAPEEAPSPGTDSGGGSNPNEEAVAPPLDDPARSSSPRTGCRGRALPAQMEARGGRSRDSSADPFRRDREERDGSDARRGALGDRPLPP